MSDNGSSKRDLDPFEWVAGNAKLSKGNEQLTYGVMAESVKWPQPTYKTMASIAFMSKVINELGVTSEELERAVEAVRTSGD